MEIINVRCVTLPIKYEKVDKKFILDSINPEKYRKNKPSYAPNKFSYFRESDCYIHFGVTFNLGGGEDRPDLATINSTMIQNLEKKYQFCSISSHDGKSGLDIVLRRTRWNECDECSKILWMDSVHDKNFRDNKYKIVQDNTKVKALCIKCFRKKWKIRKGEFYKKTKAEMIMA